MTLTCEGKGYRLPRMYFAKDSIQIPDNQDDQTKYEYITQTVSSLQYLTLHLIAHLLC